MEFEEQPLEVKKMSELKCWDCPKRFECAEYNNSVTSDKAMYELERKEEKCADMKGKEKGND